MLLKYTLLRSGFGVLTTRTPRALGETLSFSICGATAGDRLLLTRADGKSIYRTLTDGSCTVPTEPLYGSIGVTILHAGGAATTCEGLFAEDTDGVRILVPADMDLPARVAALETKTEELAVLQETLVGVRADVKRLCRAMSVVAKRLNGEQEKGDLLL